MIQVLWKPVWQIFTKPNTLLPHNLATELLGIYAKELKNYVHTKTCTQMFIGVLFTSNEGLLL